MQNWDGKKDLIYHNVNQRIMNYNDNHEIEYNNLVYNNIKQL